LARKLYEDIEQREVIGSSKDKKSEEELIAEQKKKDEERNQIRRLRKEEALQLAEDERNFKRAILDAVNGLREFMEEVRLERKELHDYMSWVKEQRK
jgi:hypothetical protein